MVKILYIEDNEDDYLILRSIMGKIPNSSYVLENVNSIQKALDYLFKEKTDLIFLDLGLPGCSGKEAYGKLVESFPNIPVIIMSGNEDKNVAFELIALGAEDFFIKGNIQPDLLDRGITYSLKRHELKYLLKEEAIRRRKVEEALLKAHDELEARVKERTQELREANKALRESEENYHYLLDSMGEGFCIVEMIFDEDEKPIDYRFLQVSPSFEKQTGLKDAQGKRMRELAPQHENYWFEIYGKIALTGQPARFENRAGQLHRWYEVYALRFGEPAARQVAIFFNDITERKIAQDEIQKKAEELKRSNEELEQFAYVASHDLQEPIRKIVGFSQIFAARFEGQIDEKSKEHLDYVVDGAKRMQALIQDLLLYSRIGRNELTLEVLDFNGVVKEAIGNLELVIKETKAEVIYSQLPSLLAHKSFIVQIFQNLISNSLKYRSEKNPRVEISAQQKNNLWEFTIADNGIGIDFQFADKLFVIFQRLHAKGKYPGTGIGLAVCKRMVERHNGKIWIEPHRSGAVFKFTLPDLG